MQGFDGGFVGFRVANLDVRRSKSIQARADFVFCGIGRCWFLDLSLQLSLEEDFALLFLLESC